MIPGKKNEKNNNKVEYDKKNEEKKSDRDLLEPTMVSQAFFATVYNRFLEASDRKSDHVHPLLWGNTVNLIETLRKKRRAVRLSEIVDDLMYGEIASDLSEKTVIRILNKLTQMGVIKKIYLRKTAATPYYQLVSKIL